MQPCIRYNPHPVSFPLQILLLLFTLRRPDSVFSVSLSLCNNARIADEIVCWQMLKHILPGKRLKSNISFTRLVCSLLFTLVTVMSLLHLIFPNFHTTYPSFIIMFRVWCKITELSEFDILAFTETWLKRSHYRLL